MTTKNTLLNKYMAGETSAEEERQLKSLLLNTPHGELTSEETAILQILIYEPAMQCQSLSLNRGLTALSNSLV